MARMGRRLLSGALRVPVPARAARLPAGMRSQVPSFAVIGVVSTVAQLVLYALFRLFLPVIAANVVSYFLAAIANTAANRRFTFGVTGSRRAVRHQLEGGLAFLVGRFPISGPSVSRHLGVLKGAGLVRERRDANRILYSLVEERLALCVGRFLSAVCPEEAVSRRYRRRATERGPA
jgi:DNA-binding transcriptional ArsR family regulator